MGWPEAFVAATAIVSVTAFLIFVAWRASP